MKVWLIVVVIGFSVLLPARNGYCLEVVSADSIKMMVTQFKSDPRGPYQGIRWFCPDGSIRGAQERCPGGKQHALIKDSVGHLAARNGLYLGQILTNTPLGDLVGPEDGFRRLKQYQMERFLQSADDGWILRKARYYRGAVQAEDEEATGEAVLTAVLSDSGLIRRHFYLVRQFVQDLPNGANDQRLVRIRAMAKSIADSVSSFRDLRIKIHGHPDFTDAAAVRAFQTNRPNEHPGWTSRVDSTISSLILMLDDVYRRPDFGMLARKGTVLFGATDLGEAFADLGNPQDDRSVSIQLSDLLFDLRTGLPGLASRRRLDAVRLSLEMEQHLFRVSGAWRPETVAEAFEKTQVLTRALVGCGFIEPWEYAALSAQMSIDFSAADATLTRLWSGAQFLRRAAGWSAGMVDAHYGRVTRTFAAFEPLAAGFIDDRIRGSILLRYGETSGDLLAALARQGGLDNRLPGGIDASSLVGLNPGVAKGTLHVVLGSADDVAFTSNGIYLIERPPAEMKPVAGIGTVSEGNPVSHVQLLARNLGIPNATMPIDVLNQMKRFQGRSVFMAVSQAGTVVMKPAEEMTQEESDLLTQRMASSERLTVPTDRLKLDYQKLPSLLELRKTDSGGICGPKAANLAELRYLFPERVAPGVVVPFGVYKRHMLQTMPGRTVSYWEFLQATWRSAARQREEGAPTDEVESFVLDRLSDLREGIKRIQLLPTFVSELEGRFQVVFGKPLGERAVFVRSDTNMEDLKTFTGAGLNLTVVNVRGREAVLQSIRDVWASPFSERSYRWRQRFLNNPIDVYPSLLLLASVPVDRSGVLVTSDVTTGEAKRVTVSFSRGVGGAVEGQSAETYLISGTGAATLLSPAREPTYTVLPPEGGARQEFTSFERPILDLVSRSEIREMAGEVRLRMAKEGVEGPHDVELGFRNGKLWLFQIRPFVENKNARTSAYLRRLDSRISPTHRIPLGQRL